MWKHCVLNFPIFRVLVSKANTPTIQQTGSVCQTTRTTSWQTFWQLLLFLDHVQFYIIDLTNVETMAVAKAAIVVFIALAKYNQLKDTRRE